MGVITPPVGVCVYVVSGMARDVPLDKVFRGSLPFLWALVVASILLVMFPGITTFLPDLISRPDAHLVGVASLVGLTGAPGAATYAASKWGVIGLDESLELELQRQGLLAAVKNARAVDRGKR